MNYPRFAAFFVIAGVLALSACNLQLTAPAPGDAIATAVAQTRSAQTEVASHMEAGLDPLATDTPAVTFTPSATPAPPAPMLGVSVNTNCRTGPGKAYPITSALTVGETAQIVGREAGGQYWVIRLPKDPTDICWVWGQYATVTGDIASLPIITPPPTPTPAPSFTFTYDLYGIGPGYQCFKFKVQNTGSITWESYTITFHNSAHGTTATDSSNMFIGYDNWCISSGSQSDLMAGETGTASVKTFLAYNPAGETFDVTLMLCSDNALGGTCASKTITFTP
jgi:hypothetical protein